MKRQSIIITALAMLLVMGSTAAAAGSEKTLEARNDRGQPIVLQGADRYDLTWQVPIAKDAITTLQHPFLRDEQGNLYIRIQDELESIDVTGNIRWKHALRSQHGGRMWAVILGKDGTVFAVQSAQYENGTMTEKAGYAAAFNKDTGELLWDHVMAQSFPLSAPTYFTGAGDEQGNLILETGGGIVSIGPRGVNWSNQELYPSGTEATQSGLTLDPSGNVYALTFPAISGGPERYSSLFCFDRQGKLLWKEDHVADWLVWMNLRFLPDGQLYGVNFYDIYKWEAAQKKFVRVENASPALMDQLRVPNDERGALYRGNEKLDGNQQRIWYYTKEDGYFYVSIYTQSDDEGNVYFTDSGGNLFSLDPSGNERFVLKANDSNMSDFPFYVTRDGTVYGFSVDMGVFRIGEKGNPVKIYVNGNRLFVPQNPEIINGNTMVPLRAIFEALGAEVAWDSEQRSISVTKGSNTLYLEIGNRWASINGTQVELEAAPDLVHNTTLVPLRFVSEALSAKVEWDGINRVVRIRS